MLVMQAHQEKREKTVIPSRSEIFKAVCGSARPESPHVTEFPVCMSAIFRPDWQVR